MRLKKREIPTSWREMNVQEGDVVKKRETWHVCLHGSRPVVHILQKTVTKFNMMVLPFSVWKLM